ncbi:hypothetical protein ABIC29_001893 [Agromyces sp. PvR057]
MRRCSRRTRPGVVIGRGKRESRSAAPARSPRRSAHARCPTGFRTADKGSPMRPSSRFAEDQHRIGIGSRSRRGRPGRGAERKPREITAQACTVYAHARQRRHEETCQRAVVVSDHLQLLRDGHTGAEGSADDCRRNVVVVGNDPVHAPREPLVHHLSDVGVVKVCVAGEGSVCGHNGRMSFNPYRCRRLNTGANRAIHLTAIPHPLVKHELVAIDLIDEIEVRSDKGDFDSIPIISTQIETDGSISGIDGQEVPLGHGSRREGHFQVRRVVMLVRPWDHEVLQVELDASDLAHVSARPDVQSAV